MSLLMVPFKVDKDYLKLKGDPEGLILTLTWVSITFHFDGLWTFFSLLCGLLSPLHVFMSSCFKRKKKAMPWS